MFIITNIKINDQEKKKALNEAFSKIEKAYGKGAIMVLGDAPKQQIEAISTGAINLDLALGIGGLPRGRIVEIYGPESSGKTTLALHCVAEAQRNGGLAAFIDAEHALDVYYAKNLGVDVDNLILAQPDTGEQALAIVDSLVHSHAVDIIVVDSVAALVPRAEIEGDMGDSHIGLLARLMSQALRKLTGIVSKSNTTVIFLNQLRQKIGVMFGNPEVTTGGIALKFYSSVRLEVRKGEQIKEGENSVGNRTKVRVVKNKLAAPFKLVEFDIMFGKGISKLGTLIDTAVDMKIISKSGSWYSYDGERLGQGREKVKAYLEENPDTLALIEKQVRSNIEDTKIYEESNDIEDTSDSDIIE
ncbi:recombinase RecA [Peptoniphilaceae bacterium SGI.131]